MSQFMDRYKDLCESNNIKPYSQHMAEIAKVTRATITNWEKNDNVPDGDIVARIARALGTTTDYLLGLSDTKYPMAIQTATGNNNVNAIAASNGTAMATVHNTATQGTKAFAEIAADYEKLDMLDRIRVQAYIAGILTSDKY
mgnify:CR=1 FL=1